MIRKIDSLLELDGKIYVYLESKETGEEFLKDAEESGFTFGDGELPTNRECAKVMAIKKDKVINYVGANGNLAFKNAAVGITRINYKNFKDGSADYLFK